MINALAAVQQADTFMMEAFINNTSLYIFELLVK